MSRRHENSQIVAPSEKGTADKSPRTPRHAGASVRDMASNREKPIRKSWLAIVAAATLSVGGLLGYHLGTRDVQTSAIAGPSGHNPPAMSTPDGPHDIFLTPFDLLALDDEALERIDPVEVDLAVARTIPGCESLDVASYKRVVDEWAEQVRAETDRHLYKFRQAPGDYKNSLAYFKALVLATVVGQDLKVGYHIESIAFDDPRDLFIHGVIDQRRGTCVSLPVLYMAIGHRLGYPIKAVTVPRHIFCRWDDAETGERFNIEAAGAGGLSDYPDEYYMSWPGKCDPRDVESGGALKTLSMREFLALKIASRGDYFWHKDQRPEAQVSYALAHQLYPSNRSLFEILASQVLDESDNYPWSPASQLASHLRKKVVTSNGSDPEQEGSR